MCCYVFFFRLRTAYEMLGGLVGWQVCMGDWTKRSTVDAPAIVDTCGGSTTATAAARAAVAELLRAVAAHPSRLRVSGRAHTCVRASPPRLARVRVVSRHRTASVVCASSRIVSSRHRITPSSVEAPTRRAIGGRAIGGRASCGGRPSRGGRASLGGRPEPPRRPGRRGGANPPWGGKRGGPGWGRCVCVLWVHARGRARSLSRAHTHIRTGCMHTHARAHTHTCARTHTHTSQLFTADRHEPIAPYDR